MRADLKRAVELVREGMSYTEAAERVGITRNQVAGACYRAGLYLGDDERFARQSAAGARSCARRWARP